MKVEGKEYKAGWRISGGGGDALIELLSMNIFIMGRQRLFYKWEGRDLWEYVSGDVKKQSMNNCLQVN